MKHLLLLLCLACLCCGGMDIHPAGSTALINHMSDSTVALVRRGESGNFRPVCTGVWVSPNEFLTAGHCVEGETADLESILGLPITLLPSIEYLTWSDALLAGTDATKAARGAVVAHYDRKHDLALVRVSNPPAHETAVLSREDPQPGDFVHIVGHTLGYPWSYSPGAVQAIRISENPNGDMVHVIQVASAASYGNSGGGLFNARGELIGICSFKVIDTSISFFMHRDTLTEVL